MRMTRTRSRPRPFFPHAPSMIPRSLTAIVLGLAASPLVAAAPMGPQGPVLTGGTPIRQVAVSPRNPDRVVVLYGPYSSSDWAPRGAVLLARSLDGGQSFEVVAREDISFGGSRVLEVQFSRSGALWVTTPDGLHRSGDLGSSFEFVLTPGQAGLAPSGELRSLAIDPFDPDHLWVTLGSANAIGGMIVRSTDGGGTWSPVPPMAGPVFPGTGTVLFDGAVPGQLLVHEGGAFFRSADGGQTFVPTGGTASELFARRAVYDSGRLLIQVSGGQDVLHVSHDGGQTHSPVGAGIPMRGRLAVNANDRGRMAFLGDGVRVATADRGLTWEVTGQVDLGTSTDLALVPVAQGTAPALVGTVLIASEAGLARTAIDAPRGLGLPLPGSGQEPRQSFGRSGPPVAIDPFDRERWLHRRQISFDRGATWRAIDLPGAPPFERQGSFTPAGEILFTHRLAEGELWTVDGAGAATMESIQARSARGAFVAPDDPDLMVAIIENGPPQLLELTEDGGQTWRVIDEAVPPQSPFDVYSFFDHVRFRPRPDGVDIVVLEQASVPLSYQEDIWVSDDLGQSWTRPPLQGGAMEALTVNTTFPEIQYFGATGFGLPLQRSNDGGVSWTPVGPEARYRRIVRGNLDPEVLVAVVTVPQGPGTSSELRLSRDGGASWGVLAVQSFQGIREFGWPLMAPDDSYVVVAGRVFELSADVGAPECSAAPSSTGDAARVRAVGSSSVAARDVHLVASGLPAHTFAIVASSRDAGFVPGLGGGAGNLCLGGVIGRLPGGAIRAGALGDLGARIDPAAIPEGGALVPALPGDTWRFQVWFRDGATSNLSDAIAITFAP